MTESIACIELTKYLKGYGWKIIVPFVGTDDETLERLAKLDESLKKLYTEKVLYD